MKLAISSVLFALPLALIACGGDDGGVTLIDSGVDIDATQGIDACVPAKPSAPGVNLHGHSGRFSIPADGTSEHHACQATATYGAVGTPAMQLAQGGDNCSQVNPDLIEYDGVLNADAAPDIFSLQLYKGYGAFATGEIRTGTFPLTGAELQYADCGVCALVLADVDLNSGAIAQYYMATSGSVTITSVYPNITGTVSNLVFQHVDIDQTSAMSTPNADNCPSAITSLSFDHTVDAP